MCSYLKYSSHPFQIWDVIITQWIVAANRVDFQIIKSPRKQVHDNKY